MIQSEAAVKLIEFAAASQGFRKIVQNGREVRHSLV